MLLYFNVETEFFIKLFIKTTNVILDIANISLNNYFKLLIIIFIAKI